ncbi:MAG: DUF5069 domain-containing protein [Nitrospira sp.]|nr:DUF5069 domain-containing protein [Nitrospira sp.]
MDKRVLGGEAEQCSDKTRAGCELSNYGVFLASPGTPSSASETIGTPDWYYFLIRTSTDLSTPAARAVSYSTYFQPEGQFAWPGKPEVWKRTLLLRGLISPESMERFEKYSDAIDPSRTDITAWSDLQDLEEGRVVPKREPAHRCQ